MNPAFAQLPQKMQSAVELHQSGQLAQAQAIYEEILALQPGHCDALNLLGASALQTGDLLRALECFDRVTAIEPGNLVGWSNRALALAESKQYEAALTSYDRALSIDTEFAEAYFKRGHVLCNLERWDAALASYEQAIARAPDDEEAYLHRGNVFARLQRWNEALASYEQAVAVEPGYAEAYSNRGVVLAQLQRFGAALANYQQAIALKPDYAVAYLNQGNVLVALKRLDEAMVSFEQAIALRSDYAEAYCNRGVVQRELGQLEAALASFDRAIALGADPVDAHANRGDTLQHLGRYEQALESYERALALKPEHRWLYGNWLHSRMQVCDWKELEPQIARLAAKIKRRQVAASPFIVLGLIDSPALQRRSAEVWVEQTCPENQALGPIDRRSRGDKIVVGYYSADFYNHATSYLMAKLFERHDRQRFHTVAFSFGPSVQDGMRKRLPMAFSEFIDVRTQSAGEIARLSRQLKIDIAVDLKGFTYDQRAQVFAHRAAPVQVSYQGYPGTMGATFIDYIMTDRAVIPEESQRYYAEKVVYLPISYFSNGLDPPGHGKPLARAELGLPPTGFVFCCFNNMFKITPEVFGSWMRILRQVEGSVLWLLHDNETAASNLRKEAQARGVSGARLVFAPRVPLAQHHARHRAGDLFLDTLPCNAHTTALDALWMGMPVLTRPGKSFAARVAASLLSAIALPDLIAATIEQYESTAIALASDPARLARIKHQLERQRMTSALFDSQLLTQHIEQAYVRMFERYQQGLAPECIVIQGAALLQQKIPGV